MSAENLHSTNNRTIVCAECELLISKACDAECTPEEMEDLRGHLIACDHCRSVMCEYREINHMMTARLAILSCPPPPLTKPSRRGELSFLLSGAYRYAGKVAALAACLLFFFLGQHLGFDRANRDMSATFTSAPVSTPSMWAASRPVSPRSLANVESEQPFTDSIGRYRAAVGAELRQDGVDWLRVRELVEAMGELRTDLELLTIHMAYLDIRTGSSPYEVAEHWERLGAFPGKTVYKP